MVLNLSKALKLAGCVALACAFAVAEGWLNLGLFDEWLAGGLALFALGDTV